MTQPTMTQPTMTQPTMTQPTMTQPTMTPRTAAVDVGLCWIYSRAMREGLAIYDLKPQEFWLAQVLVLDSYDRLDDSGAAAPVFRAGLRLEVWARQGGFEDAKGVRLDKLEVVLKSLVSLGIVDVNLMEGTFELRPAAESWSRLRALRGKPRALEVKQRVLELSAGRPLSEALSDLSREKALTGVAASDPGTLFKRLAAAVNDPIAMAALTEDLARLGGPDSANLADVGGLIRRPAKFADVSSDKSADTKTVDLQGFAASADKSAETRLGGRGGLAKLAAASGCTAAAASLASLASCDEGEASADKSAESNATKAMAYLLGIDQGHDVLQARAEWAAAWTKIACEHSEWVLGPLRALVGKRKPDNPIAFASRIARDDGVWPGSRARPRVGSSCK